MAKDRHKLDRLEELRQSVGEKKKEIQGVREQLEQGFTSDLAILLDNKRGELAKIYEWIDRLTRV
jgi:PHP family Zn ribbon phosphoesterase